MKGLFIACIMFCAELAYAQQAILSSRHLDKIENAKSAGKKLKLYKKFYSRDSARLSRQLDRHWKRQADSIFISAKYVEVGNLSRRDMRLLTRVGIKLPETEGVKNINHSIPDTAAILDQAEGEIRNNLPVTSVPRDSAAILQEALNAAGSIMSKSARIEQATSVARTNEYKHQLTGLDKNNSVSRAALQQKAMSVMQSRMSRFRETRALEQQKKSMERLRNDPKRYQQQAEQLRDSTYQREQAKKKAEELATDYMNKNPEIMNAAAKQMGALMKVYSVVPNSKDLSTAVRRSSLKGKPFADRFFVSGNFQLISFSPVSIEFSPAMGYRISSRLIAGTGMNYRKTFNDTLSRVASNMIGYKTFVSYDVIANFFVYTEYSRNSAGIMGSDEIRKNTWSSAFLLGAGRKISLHPRFEMTAVLLYNVAHRSDNQVYTNRWSFRVGFQTSALGFVKRKPEFNPR